MARVSGRLGLCRARPAHSPSHRASLESQLSRPISRYRIDRCKGAIRVTFVDEAIRGVNIAGRMTEPVRHRRTKGAATDMFEPKATASHLDSTQSGDLRCAHVDMLKTKSSGRLFR